MSKTPTKTPTKTGPKKVAPKKVTTKKGSTKKLSKTALARIAHAQTAHARTIAANAPQLPPVPPPQALGASPAVLDRLWGVVTARRDADPNVSHSARLLSRGTAKVAQKFGEEAVECVIEAARNNRSALIYESADVLYHLIVVWVNAGIRPDEVWAELQRREGVSGIAEKASRAKELPLEHGIETTKIP